MAAFGRTRPFTNDAEPPKAAGRLSLKRTFKRHHSGLRLYTKQELRPDAKREAPNNLKCPDTGSAGH